MATGSSRACGATAAGSFASSSTEAAVGIGQGDLPEIPLSREQVSAAIYQTLNANQIVDGYIRLVVTRGAGALGLDPNKTSDPQVIVIADHIALYPAELYEHGLEIITASTLRINPAALSPRIKSLNYLNNILAKIEGLQAGCIEALMLNHKGEIAECTGDKSSWCATACCSRRRSTPAFSKASPATR